MRSEKPARHALPMPRDGERQMQVSRRDERWPANGRGQSAYICCQSAALGGVSETPQARLTLPTSSIARDERLDELDLRELRVFAALVTKSEGSCRSPTYARTASTSFSREMPK